MTLLMTYATFQRDPRRRRLDVASNKSINTLKGIALLLCFK